MASRNNSDSWFWRMWSESKIFQVLVFVVPALIIFLFVRKVKDDKEKKEQKRDIRLLAQQLMAADPSLNENEAIQRGLQLKDIAERISKAFWSFSTSLWGSVVTWRLDEDEEMAIEALNQCVNGMEAAAVSDFYKEYNRSFGNNTIFTGFKGESLLADCKKFLNSSEWNRVHSFIRNSLK
jgi:hypothetical protein